MAWKYYQMVKYTIDVWKEARVCNKDNADRFIELLNHHTEILMCYKLRIYSSISKIPENLQTVFDLFSESEVLDKIEYSSWWDSAFLEYSPYSGYHYYVGFSNQDYSNMIKNAHKQIFSNPDDYKYFSAWFLNLPEGINNYGHNHSWVILHRKQLHPRFEFRIDNSTLTYYRGLIVNSISES